MLTKDLLRYHTSGIYVKPSFISTKEPKLLELASRLITIYESSSGSRREDLEENIEQLTVAFPDIKLARGLAKILADRSEFSGCSDLDYPAERQKLFLRSAALLNSPDCPADSVQFRERVLQNDTSFQETVYPDLPENERLLALKKIYPGELLERYNMSLVQSLLLFSEGLECFLDAEDPAVLRRLMKYLKFFRLLFRASLEKNGMIKLVVDGPASILENSTRYGLQLASFFPAICTLKLWKMTTVLKLHTKTLRLHLDESSGLVCHYTNFGAYIPEEFRMFQEYFNKASDEHWRLVPREAYLKLAGNQLTFPDFRFRSDTGIELNVELFHQWHKNSLLERLDYLSGNQDTPLLLGADRACLKKDEELKKRFEQQRGCFLFTSFPGVENVIKALNAFCQPEKKIRKTNKK